MSYLSKEIERLLKQKEQASLIRKQYSCGIFQEYDSSTGQGKIREQGRNR